MAEAVDPFAPVVRTRAELTACRTVARSTLLLVLWAPELVRQARPGQFVMLGPLRPGSSDPFLNRPFSIHRCDPDGHLELLVAVVGRGTRMLQELKAGDRIWVTGPLGTPFGLPDGCDPVLLLGGGLGVAPLFFLAERLIRPDRRVRLLYGAATREDLVSTGALESAGVECRLATDDGSRGAHGTTVDLLAAELGELSAKDLARTCLAACGPEAMLRAAWKLVEARVSRVPFEVSLEIRMACGMGACMGCTVFLADGSGRRVCCQGPVFQAREVFGQ